jgi:hypothetical protein
MSWTAEHFAHQLSAARFSDRRRFIDNARFILKGIAWHDGLAGREENEPELLEAIAATLFCVVRDALEADDMLPRDLAGRLDRIERLVVSHPDIDSRLASMRSAMGQLADRIGALEGDR